MNVVRRFSLSAVCVVCVLVPSGWSQHSPDPGSQTHGINVANMNQSAKPGDDFYEYANGSWIKKAEIPPDRPVIGVFTQLLEISNDRTRSIIEDAAKSKGADNSGAQKIAALFNAYMDETGIEAKGLEPLKPHLDAIAAIKNQQELARALGQTLRADVDALNNTNFHTPNLFGLWVAPGFHDSDHYAAYLLQGGLQLPDREYYLSENAHMKDIREKYQTHVSTMLKLAGFSDPDTRAAHLIALEHAIAEKHESLAEDEDIHKADNVWKMSDFPEKAPGLDWKEFFDAAGLSNEATFDVWQPGAFVGESALVASTPIDTWKDWLAFHLIESYAGVLPRALGDERFNFFGKILSGTPQQQPRWKRAVGAVNALLGDEVGKIYAQRYFPPEAKARAQAMVANIIAVYHERLAALKWMDPATKAEAQAKLDTLYVGIGYPETWRDYSQYDVRADDAFGNFWRGLLFDYHRELSRLGKPVDKHEWSMTPQTVNAVNLPLQNALNFPAAILQPPFFDAKAPDAANYGAIGSIIGHEVSHTFDTEGSTFDAKGALRNWWTPADLEHFNQATQKLAKQYDTYTPFPDLHVNGEQTLAEDIADLAGINAAFDGYHKALGSNTAPKQDGFSGDQQFFIAFAQNWASKARDAALRQQVLTDPHAPAQYRADTVRNLVAWYQNFNVQSGEKLYLTPEDRVTIW